MHHHWKPVIVLCLLTLALLTHAAEKPVNPREQMRPLWPATGSSLRTWLVCGEFPTAQEEETADAEALRQGFANDYLQRYGGETGIRPVAGWEHTRADGSTVVWKSWETRGSGLDFTAVLPGRPGEGVVWYAFTTVTRAQAGTAVFSVRGGQSMKVWVNGQPQHRRYLDYDADFTDLFDVPLNAGENAVLVKVVQRMPDAFSLRVTDPVQAAAQDAETPYLSPYLIDEPGRLVVATSDVRSSALAVIPVSVVVSAPGGVLATRTVPRGESAGFDTAGWADGPYEVQCSAAGRTGQRATSYLLWYKGDAVKAAQTLVRTAKDDDTVHTLLAELVTTRLGKRLDRVTPDAARAAYPALMELAARGKAQFPDQTGGLTRLAYRDEVDGSPQFCRVYLPPGYYPRRRYPVIINLHGRVDTFPPYVKWGGVDQRHDGLSERTGAITVYPHGRGNTWYRGLGDRDVMRCLALVKEHFSVDDDRVYLLGYSMGGAGVWYVGTRHPESFAALAPYFGGYDYRFQLDAETLAKLTPREQYRRERLSYIAQLEALRTTPVFASHGDADSIVPVDYSRYTVRLLQRWGYPIRYWEAPGAGHGGINNEDEVFTWLLQQRRNAAPERVTVRSAELRNAAAHWVRIRQRKDPYAFMQADAQLTGPNVIRLATQNVLEIELTPPRALVDPSQPVQVLWNGADPVEGRLTNGRLLLRVRGYEPKGLVKRPELEGPATDFYATPFALVVGTTSSDPLMRRMCARAADRFAAWWDERFHVQPRVFLDTEISGAEQAQYSLLLFGGTEDNAVAKAMAADIPLTVARNLVTIDGAEFPVRDAAVQLIYPNPRNSERYVMVRAATSAPAMALTDYVLNDVDFCLIDSRNVNPKAAGGFFDAITGRCSGTPILAGYFDNTWRFQETFSERDTAPRNAERQLLPRFPDASVAAQTVPLAEIVESKAEGIFLEMRRNVCALTVKDGKRKKTQTITSGLSVPANYWLPEMKHGVEYRLGGGEWAHLRAVIGPQVSTEASAQASLKTTPARVEFIVKGDGVEFYHSPVFGEATPPVAIDVDIRGVETLRLEIRNTGNTSAVTAVDWGEVRLER